jgi:hypothetical protein
MYLKYREKVTNPLFQINLINDDYDDYDIIILYYNKQNTIIISERMPPLLT